MMMSPPGTVSKYFPVLVLGLASGEDVGALESGGLLTGGSEPMEESTGGETGGDCTGLVTGETGGDDVDRAPLRGVAVGVSVGELVCWRLTLLDGDSFGVLDVGLGVGVDEIEGFAEAAG